MNQGLKHLALYAQKHHVQFKQTSKVRIVPLFAFLDQLIISMKKYVGNVYDVSWGEFIAISCNNKHFSSWLHYNNTSLQCKLISTLLTCKAAHKINLFLKFRKLVLKTRPQSNKNLDGIHLQHEQIIGILHSAYNSMQSRKKVSQGIKSLFISYRMQQAKICSCVFIEYALSLHDDIYFKQNNQATISNQNQQYGTIPQSILGYSSIISQNSHANHNHNHTNNNKSTTHQNSQASNTSQYISNFQSIIHNQNGLYRKVKSSHVSLQGFKVIDHKFKNLENQESKIQNNNYNRSKNMQNQSKLRPIIQQDYRILQPDNNNNKNRNNFQIYNNSSSNSAKKYLKTQTNQSYPNPLPKQSLTPTKYNYNYNNQLTQMRKTFLQKNQRQKQQMQQKYKNSLNYSNYSQTRPFKSPTYTQKYKSPDIDYNLNTNTNLKNLENGLGRDIKNTSSIKRQLYNDDNYNQTQQNKLNLKLIKVQQSQNQQKQPYKKQGGYQMWKKLNERNQTFMRKMLQPDIDKKQMLSKQLSRNMDYDESYHNMNMNQNRNQRSNQKSKQKQKHKGQYQSINVIHDSIVRHSGVDRWKAVN